MFLVPPKQTKPFLSCFQTEGLGICHHEHEGLNCFQTQGLGHKIQHEHEGSVVLEQAFNTVPAGVDSKLKHSNSQLTLLTTHPAHSSSVPLTS